MTLKRRQLQLLWDRLLTVTYDSAEGIYNLPYGPINSVVSVVDGNNAPLTYKLCRSGRGGNITLPYGYGWQHTDGFTDGFPVTVTYDAGYTVLPDAIKRWIIIAAAEMNRNRESPDLSGFTKGLQGWSAKAWVA